MKLAKNSKKDIELLQKEELLNTTDKLELISEADDLKRYLVRETPFMIIEKDKKFSLIVSKYEIKKYDTLEEATKGANEINWYTLGAVIEVIIENKLNEFKNK